MKSEEGDPRSSQLGRSPATIGDLATMQDQMTHVMEENQLLTNVVSPCVPAPRWTLQSAQYPNAASATPACLGCTVKTGFSTFPLYA